MATLNDYLKEARNGKYAIGHFNFAAADVLKAIVKGSKEAGAPCVMVGTSEGEADFIGMKEAVAMVKAVSNDLQFPVFLNADHFKSFEKCKEAIDTGYDSILIDGSRLSHEDNIAITKKTWDYAKLKSNISVEGELGYLRGASEVQRKIEISSADYTDPQEAADFVTQTLVDRLAVVSGNIHGIVTEQKEKLDLGHLKKIAKAAPDVFLVLHGASGLSDGDVSAAIKAGIVNVHYNTELRVAYKEAVDKALHEKPSEAAPYKYLAPAAEAVKQLVIQKTTLFMGH
ncbi:MAG: hypothetical protein A2750_00060 [Candidatus Yanofskybacteria bacterium RIFCSPHIGHO2_01_FULL_45_42]|uniref:Tagatose-bisphosphate aldolase n=3 Tax=Candidatus Yanofskyibacteriota TaxID=1752733 RepID=A0A1F8H5R8_9BACT|nr:MAG: hypothetical protein A2750_00060 [Candidatus Yanofskybacteria bacterium RIFCSPHIGHO2_01_FULL_45_42]OGN15877.1 MAG: hypothetical protein A3C81_02185 [Candidatus Yanofskybacteria bacterium RIFCSPHIGHO2_02_FULL_46_19]OGN27454.1 MAG: hypothetical protein A3B17_01640 [Candidatus Yanofskybacteria bacterium RIFCSPLOWO2_01_FULL_45_72]OGN32316.1 MAG: hypothetical protein A3J01_02550 [Candidatus Yanofskybacteria bacterium RIFCSPLOWO2_02_FULL_45_18]